jgi:geranylgeranyl diphosphate synthase type II
LGKPVGRDAALDRPSAVSELGIGGAVRRLERLVAVAIDSIPPCPGAAELRSSILLESRRFLPEKLSRRAA